MKLRTPFTIVKDPLRDIDYINNPSRNLTEVKQDFSWEKECELHPSKSTCKVYEV